ncbi:hypothetical protein [Burkholderia sp. Ac-20353]|uniref:hypothetical protein n=1 Tax=Burkholderia sp. Ac-20353 TaxID=2703894 RepID=UPI00197C4070|nr:hypothetical protein [Burkholderia sp. Ac-20353]MBN3785581.1 hypothetical protein [Burkholderia sp. Ac-20353]
MNRSRALLYAVLTLTTALATPLVQAKDLAISIWANCMAPHALEKFQKAILSR